MFVGEVELSRPTYTLFTKSHNLSEEGLSLLGQSPSVVIPPESKMAVVNCAAYAAGRRIADIGISEINETLRFSSDSAVYGRRLRRVLCILPPRRLAVRMNPILQYPGG